MFFEIFFEIFKKFQILFFQYIKLQLELNNVSIIFDNCAIKCQNSIKTRLLDTVITTFYQNREGILFLLGLLP